MTDFVRDEKFESLARTQVRNGRETYLVTALDAARAELATALKQLALTEVTALANLRAAADWMARCKAAEQARDTALQERESQGFEASQTIAHATNMQIEAEDERDRLRAELAAEREWHAELCRLVADAIDDLDRFYDAVSPLAAQPSDDVPSGLRQQLATAEQARDGYQRGFHCSEQRVVSLDHQLADADANRDRLRLHVELDAGAQLLTRWISAAVASTEQVLRLLEDDTRTWLAKRGTP